MGLAACGARGGTAAAEGMAVKLAAAPGPAGGGAGARSALEALKLHAELGAHDQQLAVLVGLARVALELQQASRHADALGVALRRRSRSWAVLQFLEPVVGPLLAVGLLHGVVALEVELPPDRPAHSSRALPGLTPARLVEGFSKS